MLLEAPFDPIRRQMNSVLLTIDLTKAVADEAIERKDCVVVAYRMRTNPPGCQVSDWPQIQSYLEGSSLLRSQNHNSSPSFDLRSRV